MEFLLINHPLDCPICDQGGECQLQDLAVGYGGSASRYEEEKRVVLHKDVGPLISMEEMSRCIHCTRCVRFGQEVAGVMELGMIHRGEHSEITTFVGDTVDSELSGNMIDICPVGALTSKPFRYSARTWELSRRKSVSPHDSTGANLIVQVKNNKVMRVVPLENEDVNECWIADRDRFSYEALNSDERLTAPMIKQGGEWKTVDWQTALEYVARGLKQIKAEHGAPAHRRAGVGRTARSRNCTCWPSWCAAWAARTSTTACAMPNSPTRAGRRRALARHLDRVAVEAAARAGGRLVPAQGPSAVRPAHPPGGAQGRAGLRAECRARRLAHAVGRAPHRRAERWVQSLADVAAAVAAAKGVARRLRAGRATRPRPSPSRCWRRAQGRAARQRRRAPCAGRLAAGAGQLDRRRRPARPSAT